MPTFASSTSGILLFITSLALYILKVEAGNSTDGTCGPLNSFRVCGKASHCCSRYGFCGNGGSYCAQGCDPLFSYNIDSCYPLPVCQDATFSFGTEGNARIVTKEQYTKVNPDDVDLIIDTGEIRNVTEGTVLTLLDNKVGTKITSTRAMHYGKVTFEMQTAWSGGVVTAAVLMGDTTEEVDIEFVGSDLTSFQSNVFYDYKADSKSNKTGTDTSTSFADYSLEWTQDQLVWGYGRDGQEQTMRTVLPAEKDIPDLPMYMQLSVWPGGEAAAEGTRNWAGGAINWEDPRYVKQNRTFEVIVKSIKVECYDNLAANQAYKYTQDKLTGELGFKTVNLAGYGVTKKGAQQVLSNSAKNSASSSASAGSANSLTSGSTGKASGGASTIGISQSAGGSLTSAKSFTTHILSSASSGGATLPITPTGPGTLL